LSLGRLAFVHQLEFFLPLILLPILILVGVVVLQLIFVIVIIIIVGDVVNGGLLLNWDHAAGCGVGGFNASINNESINLSFQEEIQGMRFTNNKNRRTGHCMPAYSIIHTQKG
jgi:hypothetical protein